jgi:hypothetical protein
MRIQFPSISRREAIQRIAAAATALSLLRSRGLAADGPRAIGSDPDLRKKIIPWEKVLTDEELKTVTALCDLIIPADEKSPAASAVGVPDFINEWVSAPYAEQQEDNKTVREGLAWLEKEAMSRFKKSFPELSEEQMRTICDPICSVSAAAENLKTQAHFFDKFRDLTAGGFYTTEEGWKDLGYVGNMALAQFPGPPPEVLKHMGLDV